MDIAERNRPVISIVMPAFNAARTIFAALQSVLNGSYQSFEIIVCDDASTDRTYDIVRSFNDPRIHLIRNSINSGEGVSRDRAIALAQGRWIAMLDADDVYTPNRLAVLADVATAHPDAIVFDELVECHDTPNGLIPWRTIARNRRARSNGLAPRRIDIHEWLSWERTIIKAIVPTHFIRDHAIRHSTKRFSADLEFYLAVIASACRELWYVPQPMYMYRIAAGSMSSVPDRFTILHRTLLDALPLFAEDPEASDALKQRLVLVGKTQDYQIFFSNLMHGQFGAASIAAWEKPWIIHEFIHRAAYQIPYHMSRWWHGAARRKTS